MKTKSRDNGVRVLAVLLLVLIVASLLFSKVFRFGRDCGRTIGQAAPLESYKVCGWFTAKSACATVLRGLEAGQQ